MARHGVDQLPVEPLDHPAEPLLMRGLLVGAVGAVLSAAEAFGLPLSASQNSAILRVVVMVGPFLLAVWWRRSVFSYRSVARIVRGSLPPAGGGRADKTVRPEG